MLIYAVIMMTGEKDEEFYRYYYDNGICYIFNCYDDRFLQADSGKGE